MLFARAMVAIRAVFLTGLFGISSACGGAGAPAVVPATTGDEAPTAATASVKAWFGAPCQVHDASETAWPVAPDTQVFIEIAEVRFDANAPAPVPTPNRWVDDPRFEIGSSMHVLAKNDAPATVSVTDPALGEDCGGLECRSVTVKPHLEASKPGTVELEVTVTPPFPVDPRIRAARGPVSAAVQDQQVVIFGLHRGVVLGVTPYVIHHADELGRLLACKQRAATEGETTR